MKFGLTTVDDCELLKLETHPGERNGNLTVVHNSAPFDINRVYYLYDVPGGESRGGHAHLRLHQLIVAVSGSFTVNIDDGVTVKSVTLNRPNVGLHIVPGIWRTVDDFSSGAVCLVIASDIYDDADYIRDYNEYIEKRRAASH